MRSRPSVGEQQDVRSGKIWWKACSCVTCYIQYKVCIDKIGGVKESCGEKQGAKEEGEESSFMSSETGKNSLYNMKAKNNILPIALCDGHKITQPQCCGVCGFQWVFPQAADVEHQTSRTERRG